MFFSLGWLHMIPLFFVAIGDVYDGLQILLATHIGVLKWGYLMVPSIFIDGFSMVNHPALGVSRVSPMSVCSHMFPQSSKQLQVSPQGRTSRMRRSSSMWAASFSWKLGVLRESQQKLLVRSTLESKSHQIYIVRYIDIYWYNLHLLYIICHIDTCFIMLR